MVIEFWWVIENINAYLCCFRYCTTNFLPKGSNVSRKVAFVCFDTIEVFEQNMMLFVFKGILAIISVVFIIATLYVYWLIPDLRDTQVSICKLLKRYLNP